MRLLETKIPPPLVALIFAVVTWLISTYSSFSELSFVVRFGLTFVIFSIGAFFCISGVVSFKRAQTTVNPLKPESASSLVNSGIYRVSRNPMYVGFAIFLLSLSVYLSSPLSILGAVGFILYINHFQIKPEERALQGIFGDEFTKYTSQVRRWL